MFNSIYIMIALIPFFILLINIFIIISSIIVNRNHIFVFVSSLIGLILVFLSLFFINEIIPIYITSLIYINFYSLIYIALIIFSGLLVNIFTYFSLRKYFLYPEEFHLLLLVSLLGAILLVISNHMFSLFFGIELMSLPIIGLMTYSYFQNHSIKSALKYIILSIISSNCMLFGIALIYSICGNLEFINIKIAFLINNLEHNRVLLCGVCFLLISFFLKLSLFPLHFFVPDLYKYTSPLVLSYLSSVMKIAVFSVLIRLFVYFPYHQAKILYFIIYFISFFSIIFGSIMALFQKNIQKLFGYSSISHMGYIIITLLMIEQYRIANEAALIYLISYFISNIGIFSVLSLSETLYYNQGCTLKNIKDYKGFFWKQPVLSIAMTIVILSFLGIPMTFGFISKFYIISLSISKSFWFINFAILINSALSLYYYFKVIINLYSYNDKINSNNDTLNYFNTNLKIVIFFFILLIILLGIFPQIIINLIQIKNELL